MTMHLRSGIATLLALLLLSGCTVLREFGPAVKVQELTPAEYIAIKRGDTLTSNRLSAATLETLRVVGLDDGRCENPVPDCIAALAGMPGLSDERRLSALAELWLAHAMALPRATRTDPGSDEHILALLEVARHAYAYLFFTPRKAGERAFEDRQTQVRDYYNYAVEQAATVLFQRRLIENLVSGSSFERLDFAGWEIIADVSAVRFPSGDRIPTQMVTASSMSFTGLRSIYRRDGFGAELVAVMSDAPSQREHEPGAEPSSTAEVADGDDGGKPREGRRRHRDRHRAPSFSEMPAPVLNVLLRFAGADLESMLASRSLVFSVHDPYRDATVSLHGQTVPLAANFTAGYGHWLASANFSQQSIRSLLGREQGIQRPHIYLMHPYDPDRRIIVLLHGLASSPEAWVNLANEIMGDERLRREFQIWQVYYPTNIPIAINHAQIRAALKETLAHFDPDGGAHASRDLVLIAHSMGGVIARLLVSSSENRLWDWLLADRDLSRDRTRRVRARLSSMLEFSPFPGISRAIFIATPHRGTTIAGTRLGRLASKLIRLPVTLLEGFGEVVVLLAGGSPDEGNSPWSRMPTSVDTLDEHDPFVRVAADLPISPHVRYHSIIGQRDARVPLAQSSDGLVPYASAHLEGAESEKVLISGHSVQQSAAAILEIRRILAEDLVQAEGASVMEPAPP